MKNKIQTTLLGFVAFILTACNSQDCDKSNWSPLFNNDLNVSFSSYTYTRYDSMKSSLSATGISTLQVFLVISVITSSEPSLNTPTFESFSFCSFVIKFSLLTKSLNV